MTSPSGSSILYHNEDDTIVLLDIPRSISAAQGTCQHPCDDLLLSCAAIDTPFASNEPKSEAAKARVAANVRNEEFSHVYVEVINDALHTIYQEYQSPWYLPRPLVAAAPARPKKRKERHFDDEDASMDQPNPDGALQTPELPASILRELASMSKGSRKYNTSRSSRTRQAFPENHREEEAQEGRSHEWDHYYCNADEEMEHLNFSNEEAQSFSFRIPPKAAFFLADCAQASDFHASVRNWAQEEDKSRKFDFIILDPPWPNASVRRAKRSGWSSYQVSDSLGDLADLIFNMDIDMLLAEQGYVGVWITNKSAVRELVLGDAGFFATWGVELVEEWLWIKTTTKGETVTAIDSLWRKPYEVLLLGRKGNLMNAEPEGTSSTKRRIIVGVPDLHSRKPCLKELIEPLMADRPHYQALEVFARYLVAGWWSWGNEVLKFNHEGCWKPMPKSE